MSPEPAQPASAEPAKAAEGWSAPAGEVWEVRGSVTVDVSAEEPAPSEPEAPVIATEPDPVAAAAVDLAREAAVDVADPGTVGDHLGVTVDDLGLTMHSFVALAKGYRGWRWAVTLAHVPGSDRVTVCDVVLLPGADSILAPSWVPWSDRLAPGDLGAGDELPYRADDPLLVPGYTVTDEDDADQQLFWELGLGRERVVGREGLDAAAERWATGSHGPTSDVAQHATAPCLSCGYFLPVSGYLRRDFGVCTNEWSPADGTVVTTDFGCGAHSETDLELPAPEPLPAHILDENVIERVVREELRKEVDAAEAGSEAVAAPAAPPAPEADLAEAPDTEGTEAPGAEAPGTTDEVSAGASVVTGSPTGWPGGPEAEPDDAGASIADEVHSSPTGMPATVVAPPEGLAERE